MSTIWNYRACQEEDIAIKDCHINSTNRATGTVGQTLHQGKKHNLLFIALLLIRLKKAKSETIERQNKVII
jgi:hypothetical protein